MLCEQIVLLYECNHFPKTQIKISLKKKNLLVFAQMSQRLCWAVLFAFGHTGVLFVIA